MTPEKTLWRGRPSFWNFWTSMAIGDLLVLLAGALWWTDRVKYAPWTLAAAAPFYLIAVWQRSGVVYTISDQRVTAAAGLLSSRIDEVEVGDIRNIVLTQSVFERLVGIGTIAVSTAAGEGEVVLRGIPGAAAVKEQIRAVRLEKTGKPETPGE